MSNLLNGKRGLIMGLANDKSIAWGIAKACHDKGAELAFTIMGDAFKKRVEPLANSIGVSNIYDCDASDPTSLDHVFNAIEKEWGSLDFVVHAIGFSDKMELRGRYVDTSPENFKMTMDISVYTFTAITNRAEKLMHNGGSILTLTYYGAEQVMPHYNVMGVAKAALEASVKYLAEDLGKDGIRVNAISAGPIKTLAAAGIKGLKQMLHFYEVTAPLGRGVTTEEVGNTAAFLCSDLASGITGEITYVDGGFNTVGISPRIAEEK